jgi:hypothetical protein
MRPMKWLRITFVAALAVLTVAGCRASHGNGGPAKANFVSAADRICSRHLQTVVDWLVQPRSGDLWQQAAVTNDGIFRIISTTIARLESLGHAPGPYAAAFDDYVGTLKARASLYMLLRIADQRREGDTVLQFQRRIDEIDALGDSKAHRYGLQICGTGGRDVAKSFSAAGWR